jgi:hypothetical protein
MRYADVRGKEQKFIDFTSLTVKEFDSLVPVFEEEFQKYMGIWRLDGKDRIGRKYQTYANCPLPMPEDRLLFILVYLKTNNLQAIHGELFQMSQSKANQWIHTLLPVLQATMSRQGATPARSMAALAQRLGQHVPSDSSFSAPDDAVAPDEIQPLVPDSSPLARDLAQGMLTLAPEVSNGPSNCSNDLEQKDHDIIDIPLFAMMGPKGASSGQKMLKNRKNIIVERKRSIL